MEKKEINIFNNSVFFKQKRSCQYCKEATDDDDNNCNQYYLNYRKISDKYT